MISVLETCEVAIDVAPKYPVSYFPTQIPFVFKLVNAGCVKYSPFAVPLDTAVVLFSNTISIECFVY